MFTTHVSANAQKVLDVIGNALPPSTYLAGGTALAMHINHRKSFDLDFYSPNQFNIVEITQRLEMEVPIFELISQSWQTIMGRSHDTEVSLFFYKYKLLKPPIEYTSIKIASLEDIASMKLEALAGRGLKRDFFDIYSICQLDGWSLGNIILLNQEKYGRKQNDLPHILKSLTYFTDAETKSERAKIIDETWNKVKEFFIKEVKDLLPRYLS